MSLGYAKAMDYYFQHNPTTLAGVAAMLRFANQVEDGGIE
jgi:hypothetical protein